MPVFNANIPAGGFASEQKRCLVNALNRALVQGLGIPEGDSYLSPWSKRSACHQTTSASP
jgi:hypothetical protein